jgi:hypothetical protein
LQADKISVLGIWGEIFAWQTELGFDFISRFGRDETRLGVWVISSEEVRLAL